MVLRLSVEWGADKFGNGALTVKITILSKGDLPYFQW